MRLASVKLASVRPASVRPMRAMILAAGKGTRLRPLTDSTPKPLIDVAGRPMIAFGLDLLREAGICDVIINLHHLGYQIRERLGDGSEFGLRIVYSEEDPILDTGGAIAAAREFLSGNTFVVLNADTAIDLRLRDTIEFHKKCQATATMVLRPDPQVARYGIIEIDRTNRIRRFLGHVRDGDVGPEASLTPLMYAGVQVFEPRMFAYLPGGVYSITRDVYPRLLEAGEPLYGYVHHGYWRVLDTPEDLAAGRRELTRAPGLRGTGADPC
jgi:NDP-sugar pyrophosphorylase family protein